jgi:trimeric autotransporter adhesin
MKRISSPLTLMTGLLVCLALIVAGCGGSSSPKITAITLTPATATIAVGATQQYAVTAMYSNNTTKDVTTSATFSSSTASVATITASGGLATAVAAGSTTITANLTGASPATATLTVTGGTPTLTSIAVTPATASISIGATQQFTATGTYSDNSMKNISSTVTWNSATAGVGTISTTGLATGVAVGTSNITAALSGVTSNTAVLTVTPTLVSIAVTPANPSVANPGTQQFTATGTYSSGPTQDITTQVAWTSAKTLVATIGGNTGLATTVGPGTSTITATLGSVSGNTLLTVTGVPVAVALQITPATPTISNGSTVQFTAVELYSDNSTHPIPGGDTVTWGSGTTTVATISAPSNPTAIGVAVGVGNSTITATDGSLTGTATLTVQAAAARFAFDAERNDITLNEYAVVPSTGTFTPVTSTATTNLVQQYVIHPSGHFLYSVDGTSRVVLYTINSTNGAVAFSGNVYATAGGGSGKAVIDPTGQFLYVVVNGSTSSDGIYSFTISQTDGTLTATTTAPYIADTDVPVDVLVDATGKFAYVVDDGDGTTPSLSYVSGYSINQSTGALTPLSTPTFQTGLSPVFSAIDPTNTYLYVPNSSDGTLSIFKINTTGLLSAVSTPTISTTTGSALTSVAITPNDQNIYITDFGTGQVFGFAIGTGGNLGAATTNSPYTVPTGASALSFGSTIDPSGVLLVICNNGANTLSLFNIGAGGALTAYPDLTLPGSNPQPQFLTFYSAVAGQ